jgi:hypothetical protein
VLLYCSIRRISFSESWNENGTDRSVVPPTDPFKRGEDAARLVSKTKKSCSNIEVSVCGVGRKLALCNPVQEDLTGRSLGPLNRVLP